MCQPQPSSMCDDEPQKPSLSFSNASTDADASDACDALEVPIDDTQGEALNMAHMEISSTCTTSQLSYARKLLYVTHFFARFSDGAWQFGIVLFLTVYTNNESLILVSTYGLITGLCVCIFGSYVGKFIDNTNRLVAAQRFIWTENCFVLLATLLSYWLLTRDNGSGNLIITTTGVPTRDENMKALSTATTWWSSRFAGVPLDATSVLLLIGIHVFGPASEVLSRGFLVAMERDWIVVMAGNDSVWLSDTNVMLKQIDLSCKIAAPAMAGFLVAATMQTDNSSSTSSSSSASDYSSSSSHGHGSLGRAALLIGCMNIISLVVEYICTAYIYRIVPALGIKSDAMTDERTVSSVAAPDYNGVLIQEEQARNVAFCTPSHALKVYMNQPVAWGGIGFALLYLNALTFGGLMTGYLLWRGMEFSTVGVWRGVSSAIGLFGTLVFHYSDKAMSIESTGMWSICFQFVCLSVAYASLYFHDYTTSLAMLIGGVCASRVGLWVFDISVTQIMQKYVPANIRGLTGGVQESLNAFFGLSAFALGIIFPHPDEFHIYVTTGYLSVGVAMIMYTFSIYYRRSMLPSAVPTSDIDNI